jgi:hypothetical protein
VSGCGECTASRVGSMRRLTFPIVMPYPLFDWVVEFGATREALRPLGEPGFIEGLEATPSDRAFFWAFETEGGLRFQVRWSETLQGASVTADPPAPRQVVEALRSLGLTVEFETRELPKEKLQRKGQAQGAVWVFTRKALAEQWLARNRFSG